MCDLEISIAAREADELKLEQQIIAIRKQIDTDGDYTWYADWCVLCFKGG